jgi:flagellar M-ring protein FliF
VAVAVNHKRPLGNDGKPGKAVPPTSEELKRVNDLVRESVGFNEKRGDTINVATASFVQSAAEAIPDTPLWKDPWVIAMAKEIGQYLIFGLIAWLVWTKLLKPVFEMLAAAAQRAEAARKAAAEAASRREHTVGADLRGRDFDDKLKGARDTAHQEPKLIAELIKEWMGAGGT